MKKRLTNFLVTAVISLVIIEALLRIILAVRVGPDLLFYGTPLSTTAIGENWQRGVSTEEFYEEKHTVASHGNQQRNYSKYFPGQKRSDTDKNGAVFEVRINNHGFRGDEYTVAKPAGLLRVACLGDSATFGYGNREEQTYPEQLEGILRSRLKDIKGDYREVEVINFGIPHMLMENMHAIFVQEVLPLKPDIITIYAGMFDAGQMIERYIARKVRERSAAGHTPTPAQLAEVFFRQDLPDHVLTAKLINTVLKIDRRRGFAPQHVEESFRYRNSGEFLKYLTEIKRLCDRHGIRFFVMTQQAQSEFFNEKYAGDITYAEEIAQIKRRVTKSGISKGELRLLHHSLLMKDIRQWAAAHQVPLIDGQAALDQHRTIIWHWVHILPEGNRLLAEEMARRIVEEIN